MSIHARIVLALVASVVAGATARGQEQSHRLVFDRFNAKYENLEGDIAPVDLGPLKLHLTSPEHSLTLVEHAVHLRPVGGEDKIEATATIFGEADLTAELRTSGGSPAGLLTDRITVPRQEVKLDATVATRRVPGGFEITPSELPRHAEIRIESQLGEQLVALCRSLGPLLWALDCGGVGTAFSVVRLPIPDDQETYFLAEEELTPDEVVAIEGYLRSRAALD